MGDYCTPPDDELAVTEHHSEVKERTDETLEGTRKVLKTCATYTTVSLKKVNTTMYWDQIFAAIPVVNDKVCSKHPRETDNKEGLKRLD